MSRMRIKDIVPLLSGTNYIWAQVQIGTKDEKYISGYGSNTKTRTVSGYSSASSAQAAAERLVPSGSVVVEIKTSTKTPSNGSHPNTASTAEERQVNTFYQSYMKRNAEQGAMQIWVEHQRTSGYSWQKIGDEILYDGAFTHGEYITSSGIRRLEQLGYDTSSVRTFDTTYSAYATYQAPIYATRQVPVYEWQWVEE